ncbi:tRNA N6-adenosine threonylcarbamoyltransferase, mitochondrial [Cyphellophora attinorum]|uniref:tRNA N6-adenosine threonylcarbamoyltransferase, mitochondrial n=1 Tax=Cyphellophora attinorum TaxID=1664694 RepID=A0A0N1P1G6_9EURO|nr:tRNA N6-adenosine threonylcarbamoyltransferase, mitochondrial [Phialophora attinorum]KPI43630.1 tRNA N6-adenosine threonylcarbamoyltransferase, mitochondrial [Phialophora attinorum]
MLRAVCISRHVINRRPLRPVLQQCRQLLTLAIETSCDDTCVAILEKHDLAGAQQGIHDAPKTQAQLHFNEKLTAANTGLGGIHPLESLDSHHAHLAKLVKRSLHFLPEATGADVPPTKLVHDPDGVPRVKPDFISVTRGPGMRSNLACGLSTAKGLAAAWSVPLLGVHHMQAHALTPRLVSALASTPSTPATPAFPFLNLLISGGHTLLLHSHSLTSHTTLATTLDIAIGDCLDKCGRTLLPPSLLASTTDTAYGKHLSNYAFPDPALFETYYPISRSRHAELLKPNHPNYDWSFQLPLGNTRQLAFSFTGICSRVGGLVNKRPGGSAAVPEGERLALARTALGTAFEHLTSRIIIALSTLSANSSTSNQAMPKTLVVSGGVAANAFLRYFLRATLDARGFEDVELVFPPPELCTDNAAMIGWCGMEMYEAGWRTGLEVGVVRKWGMGGGGVGAEENGKIDDEARGGGILGLPGWYRVES